jgi:type VI secretion system protein ImpM
LKRFRNSPALRSFEEEMSSAPASLRQVRDADRVGFFGKVPTHGDFVSADFDSDLRAALDRWLQAGLTACVQAHGEHWEHRFLQMSSWRFIIEAGLWGKSAIAGVLSPSRDRVGRSFPLVIAAQLHDFREHPRQLYGDATWFTAAEGLAESVGNLDFEIGRFTGFLRRLRLPRPDEVGAPSSTAQQTSVWWKTELGTDHVTGFKTIGAPKPSDFVRLIDEGQSPADEMEDARQQPPPPPAEQARPPALLAPSIKGCHATHPGTRLTSNSDGLLLSSDPALFAIADGVGDGPQGAEAARATIAALSTIGPAENLEALVQEIKGKLGRAHSLLQSTASDDRRQSPVASIVVVAYSGGTLAILWAGDARCYLVRDGMMRPLTRDHLEVGIRRSLSNAIGLKHQFLPEVTTEAARPGDRLMLCSAPLTRVVPERSIAERLLSPAAPNSAEVLVQEGLIASCRENLSAIVVELEAR